ncbi:MAG: DUF1990 family protein [Fimbriimonadaceae bacterium]|nr:DUF1990 family protein [Fimbriimonadaceae bacterium]
MAGKTPNAIQKRLKTIQQHPLAWNPLTGGKRGPVCFQDETDESLGADPTGARFQKIAELTFSGHYYPADAVEFFPTKTPLSTGVRIVQQARVLPALKWPVAFSIVEIYLAQQTANTIEIGYVTTKRHHGRGIWTATITRHPDHELTIRVVSTAYPNSLLFWIGLPWARHLQVRAKWRAIQEFRKITGE